MPDHSEYRIEATAFPHRGQVRGSSGIDRAVVARLGKTGEAVVVWDIAGGDIHCDISDPDSVSAAVETTPRCAVPSTRECGGAETRTMARHKRQLTQSLAADSDREPDDVAAGGRRTVADETGEGRVSDALDAAVRIMRAAFDASRAQ